MIKFLIIILLSFSLEGQTNDIWFPKEYGAYPGNYQLAPAYGVNGGMLGIVINNLEPGQYKSMSVRPAFREFEEQSFPGNIWDLEIGISTNTLSTSQMERPDAHNYNTYNVYLQRKIINLPTIYPRFFYRGMDAIITEPFYPPIIFDRLLIIDNPTNVCITLRTYNFITPYHFFDAFLGFPEYGITEGSRSTFTNTKCDNQFIFEDYVSVRQIKGDTIFSQALYHNAPYNSYITFLSNSILRSPIRYFTPNNDPCMSMIDFDNAIQLEGNMLNVKLPRDVSLYRLPIFAQHFAWGEISPEDWYAGPTRLLVAPPSITYPLTTRVMGIHSDPSNRLWESLIFILTKS